MKTSRLIAVMFVAVLGLEALGLEKTADEYLARANKLLKAGEIDGALAAFERAYTQGASYTVFYSMGKILLERGDHFGAISHFNRAQQIEERQGKRLPHPYAWRGEAYLRAGLTKKAIKSFSIAIGRSEKPGVFLYVRRATAQLSQLPESKLAFQRLKEDVDRITLEVEELERQVKSGTKAVGTHTGGVEEGVQLKLKEQLRSKRSELELKELKIERIQEALEKAPNWLELANLDIAKAEKLGGSKKVIEKLRRKLKTARELGAAK